jgi:hypothetical protein
MFLIAIKKGTREIHAKNQKLSLGKESNKRIPDKIDKKII